jgi:hypothetical protein
VRHDCSLVSVSSSSSSSVVSGTQCETPEGLQGAVLDPVGTGNAPGNGLEAGYEVPVPAPVGKVKGVHVLLVPGGQRAECRGPMAHEGPAWGGGQLLQRHLPRDGVCTLASRGESMA